MKIKTCLKPPPIVNFDDFDEEMLFFGLFFKMILCSMILRLILKFLLDSNDFEDDAFGPPPNKKQPPKSSDAK